MLIEFDPAKNDKNIAERGLSFERAAEFDFGSAIVEVDDRKVHAEVRYVAVGLSRKSPACAVLHPDRWRYSCHQLS